MPGKFRPISTKRTLVAEDLYVWVSRHPADTNFGVRGRHETVVKNGLYVCTGTPGTGFFARDTDSHSYHKFVSAIRKSRKNTLPKLLLGKEFSYAKELARVEQALAEPNDERRNLILSHYQNALQLAKDNDFLERIVRAIKDRMNISPDKFLSSVMAHYKSTIATQYREIQGTQLHIDNYVPADVMEAWGKVIEAFKKLSNTRRIWCVVTDDDRQYYEQVFFDMGIFDFIQSPYDTPVLRDSNGGCYYLYPDMLVAAHDSVDFTTHQLRDIGFEYALVDLNTIDGTFDVLSNHRQGGHKHHRHHSDALSTLYGMSRSQQVGQLFIPQLNLTFFCNKPAIVEEFVRVMKEFQQLNWHPTSK